MWSGGLEWVGWRVSVVGHVAGGAGGAAMVNGGSGRGVCGRVLRGRRKCNSLGLGGCGCGKVRVGSGGGGGGSGGGGLGNRFAYLVGVGVGREIRGLGLACAVVIRIGGGGVVKGIRGLVLS